MEFKTYRKKELTDLARWEGEDWYDKDGLLTIRATPDGLDDGQVFDKLHDSWINLSIGDYVGRGSEGEYYPIRAGVVSKNYERS